MRGEGIGQAEERGELGAIEAGAEDPQRHIGAGAGDGVDVLAGLGRAPSSDCSSSTSSGKRSAAALTSRRSARAVTWSVPGARPRPRSMRPGWRLSSVPNCSAMTSGEWLGSMMPPAPTRMRRGAGGDVADDHRGGGAGDARHVVVLGEPEAAEAPGLGMAGEIERVRRATGRRCRRRRSATDRAGNRGSRGGGPHQAMELEPLNIGRTSPAVRCAARRPGGQAPPACGRARRGRRAPIRCGARRPSGHPCGPMVEASAASKESGLPSTVRSSFTL